MKASGCKRLALSTPCRSSPRTESLEFRTKSQDRLTDNGPVRIQVPTAAPGALRQCRPLHPTSACDL
jgi:hypothetical protein